MGVECRSSNSLPCTIRQVPVGPTLQLDGQHSTGAEPTGMLPAPPPSGRIQGENKKHLTSLGRGSHKLSGKRVKLFQVGFECLVVRYRDLTAALSLHMWDEAGHQPQVHPWSWQMDTSRDFPSELLHHAVLGAQKHFLAVRSQQNYKSKLLHCCRSHPKPNPA